MLQTQKPSTEHVKGTRLSTDRCVHGNLPLSLPCIQLVLPVVHGNSSPAIVASFLTHEQHVRLVAVTCIAHSEFSHPHVTTAGSYMHSLVPHAQQLTFLWCARLTTEWLHYIVGICFVCCKPVHWVQCSKASHQLYNSPRQWEQWTPNLPANACKQSTTGEVSCIACPLWLPDHQSRLMVPPSGVDTKSRVYRALTYAFLTTATQQNSISHGKGRCCGKPHEWVA